MEAFAEDVSRLQVVTSGGKKIGQMHNVLFDPDTGRLRILVVNPENGAGEQFKQREDGRIAIDASLVEALDDCVVVAT